MNQNEYQDHSSYLLYLMAIQFLILTSVVVVFCLKWFLLVLFFFLFDFVGEIINSSNKMINSYTGNGFIS